MISCSSTSEPTSFTTIHSSDSTIETEDEELNKIVFYSGRLGNNEIYIMSAEGDTPSNLTNNVADDFCPAVSPDDTQVAFVSNRNGIDNIFLMSIYGEYTTQITDSITPVTQPSWSPDGSKILYTVDYTEYSEIWVVNSDGSNPTRLTSNDFRDERPFYSPAMDSILFMSNREGKYRIYLMDIDGTNQRKLLIPSLDESNDHFVFPQWHPDGSKIVYSLNDLVNRTASIHVVDIDGTNDVALTDESGRNEDPAWSSDGQWIIFQSERDGNFEIYMMYHDGSIQQRLTQNSAWDGWPSWASVGDDS